MSPYRLFALAATLACLLPVAALAQPITELTLAEQVEIGRAHV